MAPLSDPLAGIDDVNWAALKHAYGPAVDVPDSLRQLQREDYADLQNAYWQLYSTLYHQGTRYSASAAAVPFFYRLLDDAHTHRKQDLLIYLVCLTTGGQSMEAPVGEGVGAWLLDVSSRAKEHKPPRDDQQTYAAVQAGVDSLEAVLADPSAILRAHAAYAMAWFPAVQAKTQPALLRLLASEPDAAVRASALFSMAVTEYLGSKLSGAAVIADCTTAKILQAAYAAPDADPFVRWISALGLLKLGLQTADQLALVLQKLLDDDYLEDYEAGSLEEKETAFPFAANEIQDLGTLATVETSWLKGSEYPDVVRSLLGGLSSGAPPNNFKTLSVTATLLRIAFDGVRPPKDVTFAALTPLQQDVVRALTAIDDTTWALHRWNLPQNKADLEAFVAK